jgi:hypothetical protein
MIFIFVVLTVIATCCARKGPSGIESDAKDRRNNKATSNQYTGEASAVLKEYCDLEREQNYAKIYDSLSRARKKYLEKFNVRSAEQYRELRESSEASWSDFVIENRSEEGDGRVSFAGHARVEETGEARQVHFKAILIRENATWKVDDWKY